MRKHPYEVVNNFIEENKIDRNLANMLLGTYVDTEIFVRNKLGELYDLMQSEIERFICNVAKSRGIKDFRVLDTCGNYYSKQEAILFKHYFGDYSSIEDLAQLTEKNILEMFKAGDLRKNPDYDKIVIDQSKKNISLNGDSFKDGKVYVSELRAIMLYKFNGNYLGLNFEDLASAYKNLKTFSLNEGAYTRLKISNEVYYVKFKSERRRKIRGIYDSNWRFITDQTVKNKVTTKLNLINL